jgi:hypothetical protein
MCERSDWLSRRLIRLFSKNILETKIGVKEYASFQPRDSFTATGVWEASASIKLRRT